MEKLTEAYKYVEDILKSKVEIGMVLGSGLGAVGDSFTDTVEIPYTEIPGFPVSTVSGHAGKLIAGKYKGKSILLMKGRFHYYEGYDMDKVVFGIRVMKLLGVKKLIVTNAAGGINTKYTPGDLMLIRDHIGLFCPSPLRGKNLDQFGPRFPDMSYAYNNDLINIAKKCGKKLNIDLKSGIYVFTKGPMFETPAEIKALRLLGADAVGMSTVPEVITANHADIKVLGISCITNMAAGVLDQPLGHEEVMETGEKVKSKFTALIKEIIGNL